MLKGDTPAQDRIDKKQFENLCGLQCTINENINNIADLLNNPKPNRSEKDV